METIKKLLYILTLKMMRWLRIQNNVIGLSFDQINNLECGDYTYHVQFIKENKYNDIDNCFKVSIVNPVLFKGHVRHKL